VVKLRLFERADLGLIERWARSADLDRYASRLRPRAPAACRHDPAHGLLWYVIVDGGADVGTVWLEPSEAQGVCVLGIYLKDASLFGRGIGSAALRLALDECRTQHAARSVTLHVRRDNVRAIACYAKLGFSITWGGVKALPAGASIPFYCMSLRVASAVAPGGGGRS
jgi:RimJ/RimL family protein N-acetyltransferase